MILNPPKFIFFAFKQPKGWSTIFSFHLIIYLFSLKFLSFFFMNSSTTLLRVSITNFGRTVHEPARVFDMLFFSLSFMWNCNKHILLVAAAAAACAHKLGHPCTGPESCPTSSYHTVHTVSCLACLNCGLERRQQWTESNRLLPHHHPPACLLPTNHSTAQSFGSFVLL